VEYLLNRYLLHFFNKKSFLFSSVIRYHELHHQYPDDTKYILIHPAVMVTGSLLFVGIGFILVGSMIFIVFAGVLAGLCYFIIIHWAQHHIVLKSDHPLFNSWKRHFLHHYKYTEKAFGVSTGIWDLLFSSSPTDHLFLEIDPYSMKAKDRSYKLIEVEDGKTDAVFFDLPKSIYANDPYWISPLDSDVKNIFNASSNLCFQYGIAKRWILVNENHEVVGRIAAFIDFRKMYEEKIKVGRLGFFECINDYQAACCLFDVACGWLKDYYQINAVDGPVNFGENDKYWGLLIDGFNYPSFGMNYNPPYYKNFFEKYGFEKQYEQLTNLVDLKKDLPTRFKNIAERVCRNSRYSFQHFSFSNKEKFIKDFVEIYNSSWKTFKNFKELNEAYVAQSFEQIRAVIEESFIWFAYVDEKPAGLLVAVPDVNGILKYFNGKLNWLSKIRFVIYKYLKGFAKVRVIIMGIAPEFQRIGLESGLIYNAFNAGRKKPTYKYVQLAWVGDFNTKMLAIHHAMEAIPETKHATYRKYI